MKVLFLDIDGVLNGSTLELDPSQKYPYDLFNNICVGRVNRIIEKTGSVIVVTSSWRTMRRDKLQEIFNNVGLPEIYDVTPYYWRENGFVKRGEEIKDWMDKHKEEIDGYCILDDETDFLPEQLKHFVHTDTAIGITEEDTERAIQILNRLD